MVINMHNLKFPEAIRRTEKAIRNSLILGDTEPRAITTCKLVKARVISKSHLLTGALGFAYTLWKTPSSPGSWRSPFLFLDRRTCLVCRFCFGFGREWTLIAIL